MASIVKDTIFKMALHIEQGMQTTIKYSVNWKQLKIFYVVSLLERAPVFKNLLNWIMVLHESFTLAQTEISLKGELVDSAVVRYHVKSVFWL